MASSVNTTKYLKKTNTNLSQNFPKIEEEEPHPNLFYETSITLIRNPDKGTTKEQTNKHGPISFINNDAKTLNKILEN